MQPTGLLSPTHWILKLLGVFGINPAADTSGRRTFPLINAHSTREPRHAEREPSRATTSSAQISADLRPSGSPVGGCCAGRCAPPEEVTKGLDDAAVEHLPEDERPSAEHVRQAPRPA
jgi:hypothetical protein